MEELALDRSPLEHGALARIELVEPRGEQCFQRRRDLDVGLVGCHRDHLGEEEGVPSARRRDSRAEQLGRAVEELADGILREWLEPKRDRPLCAAVEEFRAGDAEEQDRGAGREQPDPFDEIDERVLGPLDVVEHGDERSLLFEQLAKRPGDLLGARCLVALAEQGADRRGGDGVGGKRAELFDHLDNGPVRDSLAVGEAAAVDDPGIDRRERLDDEPRLPDSGIPDDRDQLAPLLRLRALPGLPDGRELALTADEACLVAALRCGKRVHEAERRHRFRLALQLERLDRLDLDRSAYELEGRLADQDLARIGGVLEPRGDVDRVPGRQSLLGARDHLPRVHADPSLHPELRKRLTHLHRSPAGPQRVVLVHRWNAEHRHHRVADELLHRASVRLDDSLHPLEVAGEQPLQRLRVDRLAERGRADHVAEEHGDDLAVHSWIIPLSRCERNRPPCNPRATERVDTNPHRTSREPSQNELPGPSSLSRIG